MTNPVQQMIDAVGGVAAMARAADVRHTSVIGWRERGSIPPDRVLLIEKATGLPRHRMRPDLWPEPAEASA